METEGVEQEILLQPEMAIIGAVYSVNGYTGHVVLKTSDLENDSGYQTSSDVTNAISTHNADEEAHPYIQGIIGTKQDALTAGTNIQISEQNVISATDTTYSAGNGINISGENAISIDTTVVATQQNLSDEVTNRENADIYLQQQIDGISASSDVVDIVGTYAELQQYDTQHLKDNDIIKVLQDETQGGATTYYRWSTHTETFTLIGQEGPYYTKAAADAEFVPQTRTVNGKALSSNITLNASDVSALGTSDVVQTTGSSTSQVMSQNAVTTQLNTKLNASDYVVDAQLANTTNPVQNQVLNNLLGNMPTDFFSGTATTNPTAATSVTVTNALAIDDYELLGNTTQQTYSGKNLFKCPSLSSGTGITRTRLGDNSFKAEVSSTDGNKYTTISYNLLPNTTYYFSVDISISGSSTTHTGYIRPQIEGSYVGWYNSGFSFTTGTSGNVNLLFYNYTDNSGGNTVSNTVTWSNIQIEAGSTATTYEPYVGGTASPNPDYPQTVNVVTGVQTVTISDGTNTHDYTIDLGSTELCKIGTYQDYIYKSGDDWYVHKDCGKANLGEFTWKNTGTGTSGVYRLNSTNLSGLYVPPPDNNTAGIGMSNYFVMKPNGWAGPYGSIVSIAYNQNGTDIYAYHPDYNTSSSGSGFQTWCSNNNVVLYYALATPTDTKITDAGLIGQLEAFKNASVYTNNTYFEVTASDLAAILDLTVVNANANGIIYKIRGN